MVDNTEALDILATVALQVPSLASHAHPASPSKHPAHEIAKGSENNIAPMIGGDGSNVVPSPPLSCCSASGWNNVYNDVNSHSSIVHYFQLANDLQQLAFNNNLMTQLIQLRYHQNIMQTSQHILEQHHDSFPLRNFTMSPSLNNNYSQDLPIQHAVLIRDSCRRVTEPEQSLFQADFNLKAADCTVTTCPEISVWKKTRKEVTKAAHRNSAHLSRKRKKRLFEELQAENSKLRHTEAILQSVPDLIIVFDSSGCISFVSSSVSKFICNTCDKLEGTSFLDLLTKESRNMIQTAFIDAISLKRHAGQQATPLRCGKAIRINFLDDKTSNENNKKEDEDYTSISSISNEIGSLSLRSFLLRGIVHFSGVEPECVSSIRLTK